MCPFRISSLITENTFLFMPTLTSNKSWRALEHFAANLEAAVFGSATRKRTLASCPRAPYWSTNCAGTYGQKEWDSWHLKILWQIHGFDKFMGQIFLSPPKESAHFEEAGPSTVLWPFPSLQCHRNYGATNKSWLVCEFSKLTSFKPSCLNLLNIFQVFSSIKLQGEEPKLGRNAKVIVRMSQVMNPLMLLPLKSSGHASGREVLAWIRAFKCFYHLFIMSASCHHRVMCIIWTGLNQESLPPRHHSVQFQLSTLIAGWRHLNSLVILACIMQSKPPGSWSSRICWRWTFGCKSDRNNTDQHLHFASLLLKSLPMYSWCIHDVSSSKRNPKTSMTSKVLLFSVLASVGNIQTFGLSNVWPELLRHESHGLHDFGPAMKLMVLVSVGIPVGGLCALISHSKKASHKIYILFSGLLGCIGLACVAAWEHSSLLLLAMLITHMSGDPAGGSCGHREFGSVFFFRGFMKLLTGCSACYLMTYGRFWTFLNFISIFASFKNNIFGLQVGYLGIFRGDDLLRRIFSHSHPCFSDGCRDLLGHLVGCGIAIAADTGRWHRVISIGLHPLILDKNMKTWNVIKFTSN